MNQVKEGWDGYYQLQYADGTAVYEGDMVSSASGVDWLVTGSKAPHKASSTGRVYVSSPDESSSATAEYFPSVFDMTWRKLDD